MDISNCFYLGYVAKTHGIKGEISAVIDADSTEKYKNLSSLFLKRESELLHYKVESLRPAKDSGIIKLEGIDTPEKAKELRGMEIYVELSFLPPAEKNMFYLHDVIGFIVTDKAHGEIGQVQAVLEYPSQYLLQVMQGKKEVLIPVNAVIIQKVDHERRVIEVEVPEGLLEI